MDGPGHDKECADNDNETYIFAGGMLNPSRTVKGEEVIAAGGRGQERTQFLVMPFPMLLQDERENCNSDEQNRERREERRRRLHDCGGHRCRLLVGALVFGQEKARAVSAWAVGRLGPALRFARTGIFSNFVARTMERTRAGKMGKFLFFPPNILAEPIITVLMIKC